MKDWIGNSKAVYSVLSANNHTDVDREENDYYATNPKALEIFLDKLKEDNFELHNDIYECACGGGHLSKVLESKGYKVHSSDLLYRGYGTGGIDFLQLNKNNLKLDILTNPPYKYAQEFVEHALKIIDDGYCVVMFLKIQFLEGKKRKSLFNKKCLKYVYVNSERQVCAMNGDFKNTNSSAVCYCWFIWEKGYIGEPIIRWI